MFNTLSTAFILFTSGHFRGPGRAIGPLCASVFAPLLPNEMTSDLDIPQDDSYLESWPSKVRRSRSQVKVKGHRRKNVAIVVSTTSRNGFPSFTVHT